ncbi:uncharacterized protein LOC136085291 [Hydra vulgaris]|uniref:Uncharacterized protein LOC136085291 n=1 Tax=Hydra vulgaris TaxID=6087 RepID=A0ABM4CLI8_HYDVU
MSKKCNLSLETRSLIDALAKDGRSIRYIEKLLKIPQLTVSNTIRRFKCTGTNKDRKKTRRPCKTSKAKDKSVILSCEGNRRLAAQEITSNFTAAHNKNISERTIRGRLKTVGLNERVAVGKPLLKPINRKKRLQWALAYSN